MALDLSKYLSLFVAEAGEHLAAFAKDVVRVERAAAEGGDRKEAVDALFRHAHSVKGMAASMSLEGIAGLAHDAEDLADVFRKDPARLDAPAADLLLAAGDALAAMVAASATGANPPADPELVARLAEAVRGYRDGTRSADAETAETAETAAAAPDPAAPRAGAPRQVEVDVEVAGSCPVPAVRGFLVVKKLSALGQIVRTRPSVEELKAGRIPGKKLTAVLDTAETVQAVERALAQISDIARVRVSAVRADPAVPAGDDERPAAPAPTAAAPRDPGAAEASRSVRVRTDILDGFLDSVGELILATARIRELGKTVPGGSRPALEEGVDRLHAIVKDLHDKVMTVRMTPLAVVTERLPRAARDVARKVGKQVEVDVQGAEIELDRAILDELADPLLHVLRNAVDHGIEPPHLRLLAGKPATGRIRLQARRERDRVIVEISDDGKGMDPARLRAAAVAKGLLAADAAAALPDREALLLACAAGVSTADEVTDVSGRGVGLDAVKRAVEGVGGALELESTPGQGSRFTFRLPLTVAVQPVLLVRVGDEVLGLPIAKVHGATQVLMSRLDRSRGEPVLPYDGELVPVHALDRLLGFPGAARDDRAVVVADGGESGRIGLAVDALLGQQEAVLKPLGAPLEAVSGLSAVTVLGNGRPVFILDVLRLTA